MSSFTSLRTSRVTMKYCVAIFLSTIYFVDAFSSKRCLLFNKKCVDHCPLNMHPYHTRCDGQTMSQRTCDDPQTYVIGYTCGWSRCDCNADMALDEDAGLCVPFKHCPPPLPRGGRGRRKFSSRGSSRIKPTEPDAFERAMLE
uniref:SFRICE_025729 n=1 Tax=Spodoptera frugiperda TaxID=7108 RepID=A0A2H1WXC6_SPOFR